MYVRTKFFNVTWMLLSQNHWTYAFSSAPQHQLCSTPLSVLATPLCSATQRSWHIFEIEYSSQSFLHIFFAWNYQYFVKSWLTLIFSHYKTMRGQHISFTKVNLCTAKHNCLLKSVCFETNGLDKLKKKIATKLIFSFPTHCNKSSDIDHVHYCKTFPFFLNANLATNHHHCHDCCYHHHHWCNKKQRRLQKPHSFSSWQSYRHSDQLESQTTTTKIASITLLPSLPSPHHPTNQSPLCTVHGLLKVFFYLAE